MKKCKMVFWVIIVTIVWWVNLQAFHTAVNGKRQVLLDKSFTLQSSLIDLRQVLNFFLQRTILHCNLEAKAPRDLQSQRDAIVKVRHFFEEYDLMKHGLTMRLHDSYACFVRHEISELQLYQKIGTYMDEFEEKLLLYLYYHFSAKTYTNLLCIMNKVCDESVVSEKYLESNEHWAYIAFSKHVIEKIEDAFKCYFEGRFGFTLFAK